MSYKSPPMRLNDFDRKLTYIELPASERTHYALSYSPKKCACPCRHRQNKRIVTIEVKACESIWLCIYCVLSYSNDRSTHKYHQELQKQGKNRVIRNALLAFFMLYFVYLKHVASAELYSVRLYNLARMICLELLNSTDCKSERLG